eukprot:2774971-Lingulodinium_polyedra.AAC.1
MHLGLHGARRARREIQRTGMALGFAQLRARIIMSTLGHRNAQPDQLHLAGEPTRLLRARTRALA